MSGRGQKMNFPDLWILLLKVKPNETKKLSLFTKLEILASTQSAAATANPDSVNS